MKHVYTAFNLIDAQMIKDHLVSAGFDAIIKGEYLMGAVGELPANTSPTVWVLDDEDCDRAKALIKSYQQNRPEDQIHQSVWLCPQCEETIDPQFTQCWNCGESRRDR